LTEITLHVKYKKEDHYLFLPLHEGRRHNVDVRNGLSVTLIDVQETRTQQGRREGCITVR